MRGNCAANGVKLNVSAARSTLVVAAGRDTCLKSRQNDEYQRHDDGRELLHLDLTLNPLG